MSVVLLMSKHTPVQTEYAIKDHLPKGATRITAHIVVGTAGTMIDLVRRKVIDASGVKVFVLDEADNMLDQDGLGDQTLRVKKCVLNTTRELPPLTLLDSMLPKQGVQTPDHSLLRHILRPCPQIRRQVRPQLQQNRTKEGGAQR